MPLTRPIAILLVTLAAACATPTPKPIDEASIGAGNVFVGPGERLPDGAACAVRVTPTPEHKAMNDRFNRVRGVPGKLKGKTLARVDGDFAGTTDEILQWAACKWGIPADVARAMAVVESYWKMTELGDWTRQLERCAPGLPTRSTERPEECAESLGILQVRYLYHRDTYPEVALSTAYNADYALGVWRACFEGEESWLADQPRNSGYRKGDALGCFGRWAAGEWWTPKARKYVERLKSELRERKWETDSSFARY
jgi:hypothetical protein